MPDLPTLLQQIEDAEARLRPLLREVREAISDLKTAKHDLEQTIQSTKDDTWVHKRINKLVEDGLKEYQKTLDRARNDTVETIKRSFDRLALIYITGRADGGGKTLEQIVVEQEGKKGKILPSMLDKP